jgi:alkaline phosphatase D
VSRRQFLTAAAAMGAAAAWAAVDGRPSTISWRERRDLFPEGVASGDPRPDSVVLWTRRPFDRRVNEARLLVEVSEDEAFTRVVAAAPAIVSHGSDWTCRVLIGNLKPRRTYWYRFSDPQGSGSRIGRTVTAPAEDDPGPVSFAFVSCQNVNQGAQHAYRRMLFEDERAAPSEQLAFVLHLGDFIYELVWYPEDRPQGMYDRRLRDIVRYESGERIHDFHIPTTVADYRAVYRAYLHDPDLQDARARWPFVSIWDNHEFSWLGWQSFQIFDDTVRPAQTRKVAANQAWFEYHPARIVKSSGPSLKRFDPPRVSDAPAARFDEHGLAQEPNNLTALASLTGYRALRFGRHAELIITDQRSYCSQEPSTRAEFKGFSSDDFPELIAQEVLEVLDAGRAYDGGNPPAQIRFGDKQAPNFRKGEPPRTILGAAQKAWFLERLKASSATWKIWGNTTGTLDWRADPQNLPAGLTTPWPGGGYGVVASGDHGTAYLERAEIYRFVREAGITGFATVAGDRHSFWAGLAVPALPPSAWEPVGVAFVTGSVSAPGIVEALEHTLARDHPLRALYLRDLAGGVKPEAVVNMLFLHGVRSCLEYWRSGDIEAARRLSNPELAPHLKFLDLGGHGYSKVRVLGEAFECEFVCIPRPLEREVRADGGPLLYRVLHRASLWKAGERPRLTQQVLEGNPQLSI